MLFIYQTIKPRLKLAEVFGWPDNIENKIVPFFNLIDTKL